MGLAARRPGESEDLSWGRGKAEAVWDEMVSVLLFLWQAML